MSLRLSCVAAVLVASFSAHAQMSPVGLWRSYDDKEGTAKSEVRITETAGVLSGKIEKILDPKVKPDAKCDECKDERKDQPMVGLEIIRGAKKTEGQDVWEGGSIVDPKNGTVYKLKITPVDGGAKLDVRGFVGFSFIGRTQTWTRVQ